MRYKIEGFCSGQWNESCVGSDIQANTFDTYRAAEDMIPELARRFECPENEFRVVEREEAPNPECGSYDTDVR